MTRATDTIESNETIETIETIETAKIIKSRTLGGLLTAASLLLGGCLAPASGDSDGEPSAESSTGSMSTGSMSTGTTSVGAGSGDPAADPDSSTTGSTTAPEPADTDGASEGTGVDAASTFVLVHGAWMGAWSWDRVVPVLESEGHDVVVVELPAHGDDPTAPDEVTLDGYRDTVLDAVPDASDPVVLVGHSMGGMVISAVAEAEPERLQALVYVAGYLPLDGQSLLDLAFMDPGSLVGEHLVDLGDGTTRIEDDAIGQVFCADCSKDDVMLLRDRHRPEPGGPLATPIALSDEAFGSVPRYYVRTVDDLAVSAVLQDQMIAASPCDQVIELSTSHSPFLTQPEALGQALDMLAQ
ncbi:MAG: alpha/beta fold hydrolase [Myxococcota bacterium]